MSSTEIETEIGIEIRLRWAIRSNMSHRQRSTANRRGKTTQIPGVSSVSSGMGTQSCPYQLRTGIRYRDALRCSAVPVHHVPEFNCLFPRKIDSEASIEESPTLFCQRAIQSAGCLSIKRHKRMFIFSLAIPSRASVRILAAVQTNLSMEYLVAFKQFCFRFLRPLAWTGKGWWSFQSLNEILRKNPMRSCCVTYM